jgi:hypothetical protein
MYDRTRICIYALLNYKKGAVETTKIGGIRNNAGTQSAEQGNKQPYQHTHAP